MPSPAAPPIAGAATHQAGQAALISQMADPLATAWLSLDSSDPSTLQAFILAIQALVQHFGKASGAAAASFYEHERRLAGVPGHFDVRITPPNMDKVEASVRWAVKDLWSPEPDLSTVHTLVQGVVEKDVLDTGRLTIIDAVHADKRARGWARVPEPGCCSFCALLATRGAVYHGERTYQRAIYAVGTNRVTGERTVTDKNSAEFEAHDHCRCHAEPIFGEYEPSAQIREWQQIYKESTKGVYGPVAMRRAFRKALAQ